MIDLKLNKNNNNNLENNIDKSNYTSFDSNQLEEIKINTINDTNNNILVHEQIKSKINLKKNCKISLSFISDENKFFSSVISEIIEKNYEQDKNLNENNESEIKNIINNDENNINLKNSIYTEKNIYESNAKNDSTSDYNNYLNEIKNMIKK